MLGFFMIMKADFKGLSFFTTIINSDMIQASKQEEGGIVMANKVKTVWLMILFLFTVISLSGCAFIKTQMYFEPDAEAKGWLKEEVRKYDYYTMNFQVENLSLKVYSTHYGFDNTFSAGPPFLPFFPIFAKPDPSTPIQLQLEILTQSNLLTIDLSEVKLYFPPDTYFSPISFEEVVESGHVRPMTGHTITLNKKEKIVYVGFKAPFDQVKSFVLEFGDIHIGDSQITLPPLEYNKKTKYRYFPFVFSH
jgi:hypothetical protein